MKKILEKTPMTVLVVFVVMMMMTINNNITNNKTGISYFRKFTQKYNIFFLNDVAQSLIYIHKQRTENT
jgi:hypothetical protein